MSGARERSEVLLSILSLNGGGGGLKSNFSLPLQVFYCGPHFPEL